MKWDITDKQAYYILCFAMALLTALAFSGCANTGQIQLGPSGLSVGQKYLAEQNAMYYTRNTSGTTLIVYGDSGQSITALGLAAIGTFGGGATAGAPGAVVGGTGGALLGRWMDGTTSKTTAVQDALRILPAVQQ